MDVELRAGDPQAGDTKIGATVARGAIVIRSKSEDGDSDEALFVLTDACVEVLLNRLSDVRATLEAWKARCQTRVDTTPQLPEPELLKAKSALASVVKQIGKLEKIANLDVNVLGKCQSPSPLPEQGKCFKVDAESFWVYCQGDFHAEFPNRPVIVLNLLTESVVPDATTAVVTTGVPAPNDAAPVALSRTTQ